MPTVLSAFPDINIPPHVKVESAPDLGSLLNRLGQHSMAGFSGDVFFGTAFVQGGRLQFTTAMPVPTLVKIAQRDRSDKKSGVVEVMSHSNRPKEVPHAKAIKNYLLTTACVGEKFILPNFTLNYGVGLDENAPTVTLVIFANPDDGYNGWPALLLLPNAAKLDITDGAHREGEIASLLADTKKVSDEQKILLKRNAVDVKIVFEDDRADSHQDFADCAKAKPITKSLVATFDVRDNRNLRSRDLVSNVPFLKENVDATASNVNLTAKSAKIWSLSAVRMFVGYATNQHFADQGLTFGGDEKVEQAAAEAEATDGAEDFFTEVIAAQPQLAQLAQPAAAVTTAQLREANGGNLLLRGVGMAILARAFRYCKTEGVSFADMAAALAKLNWHVLKVDRATLAFDKDNPDVFLQAVLKEANPLWRELIVVANNRYKIASSSSDVTRVWNAIVAFQLPTLLVKKAA